MLAPGVFYALVFQHSQRPRHPLAGAVGHNHIIYIAALAGDKGVGKLLPILLSAGINLFLVANILAENNLHRALRAHNGNLCRRPGQIDIAAQVLGGHHIIGAAIGLAGNQCYLGHSTFGIGIEQLGAMLNNAAILLAGARHKAGDIHHSQHGNIECIAEANKPRRLARGINIQTARQHHRLVGHHAHRRALNANKAGNNIFGITDLQLKKLALIRHLQNELFHIVGLIGVTGHQRVQ